MTTTTNNENQLPKISRCPFCGAKTTTTCEDFTTCWVVCEYCATEGPKGSPTREAAIELWNNRAETPPKRRPAEACTAKDRRNIGDALFQENIHVEHVLPLHAAPDLMGLRGGWEALADELRKRDAGLLEALFPYESGEWLAGELGDNEGLMCALRQIGGWVIMGTYATVGNICLKENGEFASCSVYCGIERCFTVWGWTYKRAIAKAINEQRRYFEGEVERAREARHGA